MELDSHFMTNNLKYKCKYGYITGIDAGDTAENLNGVLGKQGYKLRNIDNTEDVANETRLTTGMAVVKKDGNNEEILARTVIFGDVDCNGYIEQVDGGSIQSFINSKNQEENFKDYQIVAMDVNHDGIINDNNEEVRAKVEKLDGDESKIDELKENEMKLDDVAIINRRSTGLLVNEELKKQNVYAIAPNKLKFVTIDQEINNYIKSIPEKFYSSGYKFEKYNASIYVIKGIKRGTTTVGNMKEVLPENTIIKCGNTELTNLDDVIGEDQTGSVYRVLIRSEKFGEIMLAKFE